MKDVECFLQSRPLYFAFLFFSFHLFFIIAVCVVQHLPVALYTDPNEIAQYLTLKLTECEKLELPVSLPQTDGTETIH